MHSINIRRVSAGVLLGVTVQLTTMPSSTGKLSTNFSTEKHRSFSTERRNHNTLCSSQMFFLNFVLYKTSNLSIEFCDLVSMVYARKVIY